MSSHARRPISKILDSQFKVLYVKIFKNNLKIYFVIYLLWISSCVWFKWVQAKFFHCQISTCLDYQPVDATWQKYLNYPLEQVIVRSNIDPATNTYSSQYKSINMHSSNLFRGNRKIPVYLKYCVELVLGEIGCGNIMLSNKKIRQVKDLPMVKSFVLSAFVRRVKLKNYNPWKVIFHLILSSNMASRLAVDFEYFATLVSDTLPKCDFEFKK